MTPLATALLALVGTLIAAGCGLAAAAMTRASQRETRTIADLRADIVVLKVERDEEHVAVLLLTDYAHRLRKHITDGKGAPPPEWPDGLKT